MCGGLPRSSKSTSCSHFLNQLVGSGNENAKIIYVHVLSNSVQKVKNKLKNKLF